MRFLSNNNRGNLFTPVIRSLRQACVKTRSAFSLIEVTFSLGIVAFGVLSIVGVMGVGLITLKDARGVQTQATIVAYVRGKLQQMSLTEATGTKSLNTFVNTPMYFTVEGVATDENSTDSPYYYKVYFSKDDVSVEGSDGPAKFLSKNAQSIKVSITYPPKAATPMTNDIPLLLARQRQ